MEEHIENGLNVNQNGGSTYAPTVFASHQSSEGVTKNAFKTSMKSLLHEGEIISEKTSRGTRLILKTAWHTLDITQNKFPTSPYPDP